MTQAEKLASIPPEVLRREVEYVSGATGWWSRVYRSARAAWRCNRIARAAARS